jgi:hypothetical protein
MPNHVVVDGSNIATEGRSLPSLAQLNEAVMAFMAEYPDSLITVVVDATFGHRIDPKETAEFDEAVANNELVAPPAGAIGRGDAFVLSIAKKVNATILTNDSFQEFHGQVDWLFDEGRLIGGKPVPHVGWVFVPRLPVRGAISRSAVKEAKRKRGAPKDTAGGREGGSSRQGGGTVRQGSAAANQPMPVPKSPPPSARPAAPAAKAPAVAAAAAPAAPKATAVNDFLPFLSFVENHPVGSSVNAVVENYSSHGAYVRVGEVKGYVPLRLMAEPAPRSAREFMKIGDAVTLVVDSFAPARRSIDLAVAGMSATKVVEPPPVKASRTRKRQPTTGAIVEATIETVDQPTTAGTPDPSGGPATKLAKPTKPARATKAAKATKRTEPTELTEPAQTSERTETTGPAKAARTTSGRVAAKKRAPATAADTVEVAGSAELPQTAAAPDAQVDAVEPQRPTKQGGRSRGSKRAPASTPDVPAVRAAPVAAETPATKSAKRTTKKSAGASAVVDSSADRTVAANVAADAVSLPAAKPAAKRGAKKPAPLPAAAAAPSAASADTSGAEAPAAPARRRRRIH